MHLESTCPFWRVGGIGTKPWERHRVCFFRVAVEVRIEIFIPRVFVPRDTLPTENNIHFIVVAQTIKEAMEEGSKAHEIGWDDHQVWCAKP
jgi:hypothetical protein